MKILYSIKDITPQQAQIIRHPIYEIAKIFQLIGYIQILVVSIQRKFQEQKHWR